MSVESGLPWVRCHESTRSGAGTADADAPDPACDASHETCTPPPGVNLTSVESTVERDIDLLGILGLSDDVRNGYQQIRVSFRLEGDDPEKLRRVVEQSRLRSTVHDVITNGVPNIEVSV